MTAPRAAGTTDFAARLLDWWDVHGRKQLPWQQPRSPYRVWVSEVMLQQTQVNTVIDYFERFTTAFPDVATLAAADLDAVLHLWSGLGYYARGRNLHRAADTIVRRHDGRIPDTHSELEALPGIGRSTAGAILAMGYGQRATILDGNVKRVLARHHGIDGWPGRTAVARRLWSVAETLTPHARVADYTQAIMDLGASVCARSRPSCDACPLACSCVARARGTQSNYPSPRPQRTLPVRRWRWHLERDSHGHVRLRQRPPSGIWGGLWAFPESVDVTDPPPRHTHIGDIEHAFTHFRLVIELVDAAPPPAVADAPERWIDPAAPPAIGLAAPVARVLRMLAEPDAGRAG